MPSTLGAFGLAALLLAVPAHADEAGGNGPGLPPLIRDGETFTVIVENDLFGGTDQNYTNGLFVSRLSAANDVPGWYARFVRGLGLIDKDHRLRLGVGFGHSIFTPQTTQAANPSLDERPYAAWAYASALLVAESPRHIRSLQVNMGLVGPSAQGAFVQNNWHALLGEPEAQGWDYQLEDEFGIQVIWEHRLREVVRSELSGLEYEIQGGGTLALGNVSTYGAVGAMLRMGPEIGNDYGPPRIRPSLAGAAYFDAPDGFNWQLFAGGELRAVAHNIFLDGNTFTDSRHVERRTLTGDLQFGLTLQYRANQIAFSGVYRFEEYESQDEPDRFGAIIFSRQF